MPKKIVNGWYEYQPNKNCTVDWLDLPQIVQVIEGMVWATAVIAEVSVRRAKANGRFVKRIELSK
ncbi:hypothetical protein [Psychromonas sp. SR45-3]|uniref:hypothetical protein n=1 Tax=Psychromonas sp. SR45-3 TaxID=2760930 RepID=UPI0015F96857|nr:hypothetical protein [Psychromonas sp. SR45-3]MBB1272546.1 hypothetical protein [Psychromonas sp. SR45-3]